MADYYLCEIPRASRPFYIESIRRNLWSMEELCYFMWKNVYLIDETLINTELCDWLETELGQKGLADTLRSVLKRQGQADEFVMPIFRQCGYIKPAELSYFCQQLSQVQIEPRSVRLKMKGDYLVNCGMYVGALKEYERIMEKRARGRLGIQFYATVLENMATAYARMFCFEEAGECLWDSYQTLRSRKVYEKYLRLLPLYLPEHKYRERLEEIKADRKLAADMRMDAQSVMKEGLESDFAKEWDEVPLEEKIEELKKEYVKCTTNAER